MKIIALLQKLGILRFGAKAAVYRDGTGRPVEFMMDDVFNAEKDLAYQNSAASNAPPKKRSRKYSEDSSFSMD